MSGIHYKWGSPMPLLLQSVMQPINITDEPLFQIYVLGKEAVGKLQRPFKIANPLADMLGAGETDATPAVPDAVARKVKAANAKKSD